MSDNISAVALVRLDKAGTADQFLEWVRGRFESHKETCKRCPLTDCGLKGELPCKRIKMISLFRLVGESYDFMVVLSVPEFSDLNACVNICFRGENDIYGYVSDVFTFLGLRVA
jgi:hypothetical protein